MNHFKCPQFQQSMSESEVKEDDNETEHNSTTTPNPAEIKKKRKKRKKRSGKQGAYHRSSEDNADVRIQNVLVYFYKNVQMKSHTFRA